MQIETKQIRILGNLWTIRSGTHETDKELDDYTGGVTDVTSREIIVKDIPADEVEMRNEPSNIRRIIRHEIIHAFLYECGLYQNASGSGAWPMNEEMVDWIAIQHEKLHRAFRDAGALDDDVTAHVPLGNPVPFECYCTCTDAIKGVTANA